MSIVTADEVKSLTGLTSADNAFIAAAIPVAEDAVKRFCDRSFDMAVHCRWMPYTRTIVLPEWPVSKLIYFGSPYDMATLSFSAGDLGCEILSDRVRTYSGFAATDFTFAANPTLADLKAAIETATGFTVDIVSGFAAVRSELLMPGSGLYWYGAQRLDIQARLVDGTDRVIQVLEDRTFSAAFWGYDPAAEIYVRWEAGYATADMPQALKQACANIVKDLRDATRHDGTLKSQTITNYSETFSDLAALGKLVEKQEDLLLLFRRTTVA